ncbi:hypothetical protein NL676_007377 [Syzygium grande]|nr:hypothetical protein NL676_007377 [Syzygium grande]
MGRLAGGIQPTQGRQGEAMGGLGRNWLGGRWPRREVGVMSRRAAATATGGAVAGRIRRGSGSASARKGAGRQAPRQARRERRKGRRKVDAGLRQAIGRATARRVVYAGAASRRR